MGLGFPRRGSRNKKRLFYRPCYFCKKKMDYVDYKDLDVLKKFTLNNAQITPRRFTGTCTKHQRGLSKAIKLAREMALIPYVRD